MAQNARGSYRNEQQNQSHSNQMDFQDQNPNGNGFNIFDNKEIKDNVGGSNQARKQMLKKLVDSGNIHTLQLKVLSSAHLEKDFTLEINPMGVIPQNYNLDSGLSLGNDNGPRRQEYDGFTYFGSTAYVLDNKPNDG